MVSVGALRWGEGETLWRIRFTELGVVGEVLCKLIRTIDAVQVLSRSSLNVETRLRLYLYKETNGDRWWSCE